MVKGPRRCLMHEVEKPKNGPKRANIGATSPRAHQRICLCITCLCVCLCLCTYTRTRAGTCTCMHVCARAHTHAHTRTRAHACTCTCVRTCMCTCVHACMHVQKGRKAECKMEDSSWDGRHDQEEGVADDDHGNNAKKREREEEGRERRDQGRCNTQPKIGRGGCTNRCRNGGSARE